MTSALWVRLASGLFVLLVLAGSVCFGVVGQVVFARTSSPSSSSIAVLASILPLKQTSASQMMQAGASTLCISLPLLGRSYVGTMDLIGAAAGADIAGSRGISLLTEKMRLVDIQEDKQGNIRAETAGLGLFTGKIAGDKTIHFTIMSPSVHGNNLIFTGTVSTQNALVNKMGGTYIIEDPTGRMAGTGTWQLKLAH